MSSLFAVFDVGKLTAEGGAEEANKLLRRGRWTIRHLIYVPERGVLIAAVDEIRGELETPSTFSAGTASGSAPGRRAPTIPALRNTPSGVKPVQAMAGVFAVAEGEKFNTNDEEPAPPPLLSPQCDLTALRGLIANV